MSALGTMPVVPIDPVQRELREDEAGVERVGGVLQAKPVSMDRSETAATIIFLLRSAIAETRSCRVFDSSLGYKCFPAEPTRFRKPDLTVVRAERLTGLDPKIGMFDFPPDLAVEVVSAHDLADDLSEKVDEYLSNDFPLVWVVYPSTKTVHIYRADGSVALLHEKDEITGELAIPEFKVKVAEFFES